MFHKVLPLGRLYKLWVSFILFSNSFSAQSNIGISSRMPWKGYAVLGNGHICAVYSDDSRLKNKGIQNLYFDDFSCSYIGATYSNLFRSNMTAPLQSLKDSVGMAKFFTTSTLSFYANSVVKEVNCYATPHNGIVLSVKVSGHHLSNLIQKMNILLRKGIFTNKLTYLKSVVVENGRAIAEWSNHKVMVIGCKDPLQKISVRDSVVSISGKVKNTKKVEIVITMAKNIESAISRMNKLLSMNSLSSSSENYWNDWMNKGDVPLFSGVEQKYTDYYKRNLYAIKSLTIRGFVPADVTGYFTTNSMPQLYPRDAMMCARVFLLTGHLKEAKAIITFWADRNIPMKSKGEWYARYDAHTDAVNAGAGARFDEPEWDAAGYYIQLVDMYYQKTGKWLVSPDFIYELADFLTSKIDKNGLLFEGGIIEWSGYLPATNMTCAAALKTASGIALNFGDHHRAEVYENGSKKISSSLHLMFDKKNETYTDVRFIGRKGKDNQSLTGNTTDTLYLWNTTMLFGILWGYPNHKEVELSNLFYQNHTVKMNGGVQYFTAPDIGLTGYGNCMFIFSTAARSEYESLYGDPGIAKMHIDWMIKNANTYGLMPERVAVDQSDISPASPLTWACAEFSEAVQLYQSTLK